MAGRPLTRSGSGTQPTGGAPNGPFVGSATTMDARSLARRQTHLRAQTDELSRDTNREGEAASGCSTRAIIYTRR